MKKDRSRSFGIGGTSCQKVSCRFLSRVSGLRWRRIDLIVLAARIFLIFSLVVSTGPAMAATEGSLNNFFGDGAGTSTTGGSDSFFGGNAGHFNEEGIYNSFFGRSAGYKNVTGHYNSFFGTESGYDNTVGDDNSFFGTFSGDENTSGNFNSFFGASSGGSSTVENCNTLIGSRSDLDPATHMLTNATAIGYQAYVSQSNSLVLGSIKGVNYATDNVNVGIGISAPARQLHLKGDNAVFRMDRSTDTSAFMIVRTNLAGTAVLKTFVVGTNASGSNDGEFVINDLGNAVGGPGNRRMTIDNSGDAEFTGSVTATGFYPSSSIALKTNVRTYGNALETVKRR